MPNQNDWIHRCEGWDYRRPAFYMVTLTTAERVPLLGELIGGVESPFVKWSPVGKMVKDCWEKISDFYPQVAPRVCRVMPDHFHGLVWVREAMEKPLGAVIRSFKAATTSAMRKMPSTDSGYGAAHHCAVSLWSEGFNDTILFHRGQLTNMHAYILDNPRRLAIKRANPDLFKIVRDLPIGDKVFAAIGNHFLLDAPVKVPIQCSRSIWDTELENQTQATLAAAQHGAVAVSPCISPGEKEIARAVLAAKLPLIVLVENGFPPLYKPPKTHFDACAAGLLLMLAPWPHHGKKHTITRSQCLQLNQWAEMICKTLPQSSPLKCHAEATAHE